MDVLVSLLWVGGAAAVLAALLTYAFGRSGLRIVLLLLSGGVVLLAWYGFFRGAGVYEESCSDCGLGAVVAGVTLIGNAVGWTAGVGAGLAARSVAGRRRSPHAGLS